MAKPIDVTDATFEAEVINSEVPVLVDFWAPWCGPCRALGTILNEIATERGDALKVVKVNVDDEQRYAAKLGVMTVPTMVLFQGGQQVDKMLGALPKRAIVDRIDKAAAAAAK